MPSSSPTCRPCTCNAGCCAKERLLTTCARLMLSCRAVPVTSRRLAEEAAVNHTLIAYHFGGMEQLSAAAVQYVEARLHIELVPEIAQFTASLAASGNRLTVFEDACTRLVEFLLLHARQLDVSRGFLAHRTCTHRLYPLYAALLVQPLHAALSVFLSRTWDAAHRAYTVQDVALQTDILLSTLLVAAHRTPEGLAGTALPSCSAVADPQRAVRQIVRAVLASLDCAG